MRTLKIATLYLSILIFTISCREIYEPEVLEIDYGFLVVEGFVEVGGAPSLLKLGKSTTIYAEKSIRHIDNAQVILSGSVNGNWQYSNLGEGEYRLDADLPVNQQYKLEIYVAEGEHYESEWMQPKISPEIKQLYFQKEVDGDVYIYLDSKGTEEGVYYRWDYEENWEFKTPYITFYRYDDDLDDVVIREDNINLCYKYENSNQIILGTSSRTVDGALIGVEILRIPSRSEKLGIRYSIDVIQNPLDQRAFEFWEAIRKNTDDIGNIFSPMPSIIESNIRKIGEDIPVIGFVSAGKSAKKRLFIEFSDIRPWSVRIPEYENCARIDTVPNFLYASFFNSGQLIPLEETTIEWPPRSNIRIPAFISSEKKCVDCRLRGSNVKPDFWD